MNWAWCEHIAVTLAVIAVVAIPAVPLVYVLAKLIAFGWHRGKADARDYDKQRRTGGKMVNRFLSNQEEKD